MCRYETTKAGDAVKALKASLKPQATACRDGKWQSIDAALLVPGDLVLLGSGSHIPADCRVSPEHHCASSLPCHVSQSALSCAVGSAHPQALQSAAAQTGRPGSLASMCTWHRCKAILNSANAIDTVPVALLLRQRVADS